MHIFTKSISVIMSAALLLALCAGCGDKDEQPAVVSESVPVQVIEEEPATEVIPAEKVSLSDEDQELLTVMAEDIQVVDDESFASVVTELMYHVGEFNGLVYQIDGIFTTKIDAQGTPYLYRTLVNGEETTVAALPIVYLEQDIAEGSWVRVTGIVGTTDVNGAETTALELVTIENIDAGADELVWSGSEHAHGSASAE